MTGLRFPALKIFTFSIFFKSDSFKTNLVKGTVSIISSYSPCKDDNVRFSAVPLKTKSDRKSDLTRKMVFF